MEPDRISCLPSHLIDEILSRLPLREAVRTCVLSSMWRYRWTTLPNLVFDHHCASEAFNDYSVIKEKLAGIIDHVVSLHSGPINKFEISHVDLTGVTNIDRWALHLSRMSVNELLWDICHDRGRSVIPSCLFACQSLVYLGLANCWLKPTSTFQGFKKLKRLHLMSITLAQDVFENLMSSCPLLETLTLFNYDGFDHLKIDLPKLRYLDVGGEFDDVRFTNAFHLSEVSINLYPYTISDELKSSLCLSNLLKFFVNLPHVRRLNVAESFLEYLAIGVVPLKLPIPCVDLNYLSICLNFNDSKEVSVVLCLSRSSPNLQELRIQARSWVPTVQGTHAYCWEDDYWSFPFMQLRFVWIDDIVGSKPQLDFISFLLLDSPVLERMTMTPAMKRGLEFMPTELLRFRRASRRAEIIFMEPRASYRPDMDIGDPPVFEHPPVLGDPPIQTDPPEFITSSLFSDLVGLVLPPGLRFMQSLFNQFNRVRAVLVNFLFSR